MPGKLLHKITFVFSLLLLLGFVAPAVGAATSSAQCSAAGTTGLTTLVTAFQGETIAGSINATGCDLGVYIPPGANGVTIIGATITGAGEHAILAQNVVGLVISGDVISGNGVAVNPSIADSKAIELVGTANASVVHNVLSNNGMDGGIALTDDGPVNPGAPNPGTLAASVGNTVEFNSIYSTSPSNCGIVVAAFNAGAGLKGNVVLGNAIYGNSPGNPGPGDGQIVVAGDAPGVTVANTVVQGNIIQGSLLPGVVVHSNAPGDIVSGTIIANNNIVNNGGYPIGAPFTSVNDPINSTGIAVIAEAATGEPTPPVVSGTSVVGNTIMGDTFGIWTCQTTNTVVTGLNVLGNPTASSTHCAAGA